MAKSFHLMPGPKGLPLIGTLLRYSPLGKFSLEKGNLARQHDFNKYGKIYKEKLGPLTLVHMMDPKDISHVFRNDGKYPLRSGIPVLESAGKRGSVQVGFGNLNGEEWYNHRQAVHKLMMAPDAAAIYLPQQNRVSDDFIQLIADVQSKTGHVDNMYNELLKYAAEAFGVVCFNERLGMLKTTTDAKAQELFNAVNLYFESLHKSLFEFPLHRYFNTKTYNQCVGNLSILTKFANGRIQDTLQRHSDGEDKDFLNTLMQADISLEVASSILVELFTAGIDSTGSALSFLWYNLASFPDKQEKLRVEIQGVLGKGEPVTQNIIKKLPYLKACLKESFRMNFPVLGGTARILQKDMELGGYQVPEGTLVAMNNMMTCMEEEWVSNPEEFIPERWLPQKEVARPKPFVLLPFGHGSRMCLGRRFAEQEAWLATIKVIQNFRLEYEDEPLGMQFKLFSTPDRPLRLKFTDVV